MNLYLWSLWCLSGLGARVGWAARSLRMTGRRTPLKPSLIPMKLMPAPSASGSRFVKSAANLRLSVEHELLPYAKTLYWCLLLVAKKRNLRWTRMPWVNFELNLFKGAADLNSALFGFSRTFKLLWMFRY